MDKYKLKTVSPHMFFVLLCIVIPSLFLFILASIPYNFLVLLFYDYSPLTVMLILYIFGRRYLTSIDIELYGGLSSRIVVLYLLLLSRVIRRAPILDNIMYIPLLWIYNSA